jgi:TolB protein
MRLPSLMTALSTGMSLAIAGEAGAQGAAAEEMPRIRITDPNRDLFKLALPNVVGDGAAVEAQDVQRRALDIMGIFNLINPAAFPPDLQREGMGFSSALWSQIGAQGVGKLQVSRQGGMFAIEGRLYQLGRGETPVLTKSYRGPALRPIVLEWVNDVIQQFTGIRGPFGSRIAFAQTGRQGEIATIGADGADLKVLTSMKSECLMPAYSPDGSQIAFTSYLRGTPDLWLVSSAGGRARAISKRHGMNSGADWAPDGGSLVATLSFEGNAELYRLSTDGSRATRLTRGPFIDMSATHSPDGSQIAFVSDRGGSPQVYVMPASGGSPPPGDVPGRQQPHPALEPRPEEAAHRLHRAGREGPVRHFHVRHADAEDRARHPEPGLQPEPGLVARRAAAGLRLQPWGAVRRQPGDPQGGADPPRAGQLAQLGTGAANEVAGGGGDG